MYIIIEAHGGAQYAAICTNSDGENEVFDTFEEASKYAEDVQNPIIVEIS